MRGASLWAFLLVWCASAQEPPAAIPPVRSAPSEQAPAAAESPATDPGASLGTNAPATNAPYRIPQNQIIPFLVPLTREAKISVANSKNPPVEYARAGIAVPTGFDPEIPHPILLIGASSDGEASSLRSMQAFTNVALRLGWVVIAAESPQGKVPHDNPPWRWAMISALLDHMHRSWPGSKRWPIASAGVSGGGKWAGVVGAILANKGYKLVGVFMGAVNQDFASEAAKLYEPAARYKQTPIFLSSGTEDKIATPQHHHDVKENLLHHGFTYVRLETFKGGHALAEADLRKALNWFLEVYGQGNSP